MMWEKTQVDWQRGIVHFVLIQHLEKSLESFMQLISFCNFLCLASEFKDSVLFLD